MNKPICLGLSILEILMHEFWYDNAKTKIW